MESDSPVHDLVKNVETTGKMFGQFAIGDSLQEIGNLTIFGGYEADYIGISKDSGDFFLYDYWLKKIALKITRPKARGICGIAG